MKKFLLVAFIAASPLIAQKTADPVARLKAPEFVKPTLSAAEQIAVSSLEQKKIEARKAFEDAQGAEQTIIREWAQHHPGFHLDPNSFMPEEDVKAPTQTPAK